VSDQQQVWKFPVPISDFVTIGMPRGARPLDFQNQDGSLWLWALVDPEQEPCLHDFRLAGTGHRIEEATTSYIGTVHKVAGMLVFHLFDLGERP
jgi:hypothetical protein